jgi:hypothetical protein
VALAAGVTAAALVAALLVPSAPPLGRWAGLLFHLNAGLNVVAVVAAFRVLQGVPAALREAATGPEVGRLLLRYTVLAAALMGVSAGVAIAVTWLTGERINLAFVGPFLGVVALVFPTEGRVRRWAGG